MKIPSLPHLRKASPPQGQPAFDPTQIPPEVIDLSELPADAKRVRPIEDAAEAMNVTPPVLERPVLMVHGLAQHADTWAGFKNFLCARPENKWGGVFRADQEKEFRQQDHSEAKVFALDVSDNLAAPRVVANEVRRAITSIMEATGAGEVDVISHSMGSLVTRESMRQGEDAISNLCMIAPPNQGAYEATAATFLGDSGVYGHYPHARMGAMDALRLEYGPDGGVRNQWLHGLNEHWRNDPDRPRAAIITGIGIPTPDRSKTLSAPGDAMVAARRAPLEGAEFHLAVPHKLEPGHRNFRDFQDFRYNHLQIVSEPEIWRTTGEFLAKGVSKNRPQQSFDDALREVKERNEVLRQEMVEADAVRQDHDLKQQWGARVAGAGAAGAVLGLALSGTKFLGAGLTLAGVAALGAGGYVAYKHGAALGKDSQQTVEAAEESLNLADSLVHRYRRSGSQRPGVEVDKLIELNDQTAASRGSVVQSDFNRRHHQRWQRRGVGIAAAGAAVSALGMVADDFFPINMAMLVGAAGLASGAYVTLRHSSRLAQPAEEASQVAHQAVTLSDNLVDQFNPTP